MPLSLKCPRLPFNGKGIYIFAIDDGCNKCRSGNAVTEQINRPVGFYDLSIVIFCSINMVMMLINDECFRDYAKTIVNIFRELLVSIREFLRELLIRKLVLNNTSW